MLQAFKDLVVEMQTIHEEKRKRKECVVASDLTSSDTPKRETSPLNLAWNLYCTVLSLPGTSQGVLEKFHAVLVTLNWSSFDLDMQSAELMLQLRETRHPRCFRFLAEIFAEFPWAGFLKATVEKDRRDQVVRIHACFFDLLLSFGTSQPFLQSQLLNMEKLYVSALDFDWQFIDRRSFEVATTRFNENCDPSCICEYEGGSPAYLPVRLLKSACVFDHSHLGFPSFHPETAEKRISLIRLIVDLAVRRLTNDKPEEKGKDKAGKVNQIISAINGLMTELESLPPSHPDGGHERHARDLVTFIAEFFSLVNRCPAQYLEPVVEAIRQFLAASPGSALLLPSVVAASQSILSFFHMTKIVETCIETHFLENETTGELGQWDPVLASVVISESALPAFLPEATRAEGLLTVYAVFRRGISECRNAEEVSVLVCRWMDWLESAEIPKSPANESKLLLLLHSLLESLLTTLDLTSESEFVPRLLRLNAIFLRVGGDKANHGSSSSSSSSFFAGLFGRASSKQTWSPRFRLVVDVVVAFSFAQISDDGKIRRSPDQPLPSFVPDTNPTRSNDPNADKTPKPKPYPPPASEAEKHFLKLTSLLKSDDNDVDRKFADLRPEIESALDFIGDSNHAMTDVGTLMSRVLDSLYPNCKYFEGR